MKVEKITRIPIRDAFKFEYKHFTPWLCENIDVLGEAIGVELRNPEREQSTGNFNVDIKAEDGNGNIVVIENQYGSTNHDHLGKLITYLTSFGCLKDQHGNNGQINEGVFPEGYLSQNPVQGKIASILRIAGIT